MMGTEHGQTRERGPPSALAEFTFIFFPPPLKFDSRACSNPSGIILCFFTTCHCFGFLLEVGRGEFASPRLLNCHVHYLVHLIMVHHLDIHPLSWYIQSCYLSLTASSLMYSLTLSCLANISVFLLSISISAASIPRISTIPSTLTWIGWLSPSYSISPWLALPPRLHPTSSSTSPWPEPSGWCQTRSPPPGCYRSSWTAN